MKTVMRFNAFIVLFAWLGAVGQDPHEITLCWDVSYSMQHRNWAKEREFLSRYFEQRSEASVSLLIFSNTVWGSETFQIRSGNWTELKNRLEALPHDGATSYKDLAAYSNTGETLIFTDGNQNLDESTPVFDGTLHIVNSNPYYNSANLNLMALLNEGELVNLSDKLSNSPETPLQPYFGRVYGDFSDFSSLLLRIKGREQEVYQPDSLGNFSIPAAPGEVLIFGRSTGVAAEQELGNARNINIWLEESGEIRLDEVVVTDSNAEAAPEKVNTALGVKNRDDVGYTAPSIGEDQINDVETEASNAVQGKFSGVRLGQSDRLSQVEIRSKWSVLGNNYGLVVIDGVPMAKANSGVSSSGASVQKAGFIDPKNIASITVLKGLAATNRYGSLGANGVILIVTKTAAGSGAELKTKKDLALLKDNIYEGKIRVSRETPPTVYISELKKGKDVSGAYDLYLQQRFQFAGKVAYFIDVFEYFKEAGPELALRILSNILEKKDAGWPALRAMLFKSRELGEAELEYRVAQRLLEEYPDKIQSYLDLARAYRSNGNYQLALNMLLAMLNSDAQQELDFNPLKKTVERDLSNLLALHSGKLDLSKLPATYRNTIQYNARISFEWNSPDADFELQFVNPQKRFFTWAHGRLADSGRLKTELNHGFAREEFEIFGPGVEGEWIINVTYKGNNDEPVFLNCTITHNFGKPGQVSREYVLRLHEPGSETQLAKIRLE